MAITQSLRAAGAGGRAVAPTQTPLVSTHPPKIAIPLLGGTIVNGIFGRATVGPSGLPIFQWPIMETIFAKWAQSLEPKSVNKINFGHLANICLRLFVNCPSSLNARSV